MHFLIFLLGFKNNLKYQLKYYYFYVIFYVWMFFIRQSNNWLARMRGRSKIEMKRF